MAISVKLQVHGLYVHHEERWTYVPKSVCKFYNGNVLRKFGCNTTYPLSNTIQAILQELRRLIDNIGKCMVGLLVSVRVTLIGKVKISLVP